MLFHYFWHTLTLQVVVFKMLYIVKKGAFFLFLLHNFHFLLQATVLRFSLSCFKLCVLTHVFCFKKRQAHTHGKKLGWPIVLTRRNFCAKKSGAKKKPTVLYPTKHQNKKELFKMEHKIVKSTRLNNFTILMTQKNADQRILWTSETSIRFYEQPH